MEFAICCCGRNSSFGCVPRERKALLKFKASLFDTSNRLSSWDVYDDCCAWDGVTCHKTTGRVIGLDLRNNNSEDDSNFLQGDQLDSSLLELKYLSYLDLSYNDFQFSPIPTFLGSMKQLQYLNLSRANFGGHVPHNLGNLSSMRTLDLNDGALTIDDLMWASNLTSLENLDLSRVNLSRTKSLLKATNYNTSGPHRLKLRNLMDLDLGFNLLHQNVDWISEFLQDKCHLKSLNLEFNQLYGEISGLFKNSSRCWIDKLEKLSLRGNKFYGNLPEELGELKQLNQLDLSSNNFSGPIPWRSLGKLSALTELDLSDNMLSGSIPSSLGDMKALRVLNLEEIPTSLGQLSNLESFDLSFNSFNGTTLCEAHFANLSNCSISGTLPNWLQHINLSYLYLSNNHIEGPIQYLFPNITDLHLSNNMINT